MLCCGWHGGGGSDGVEEQVEEGTWENVVYGEQLCGEQEQLLEAREERRVRRRGGSQSDLEKQSGRWLVRAFGWAVERI